MAGAIVTVLGSAALLAGCGDNAGGTTQGRSAQPLLSASGTNVNLVLLANENSNNNGFNFNGASDGGMTVTVPVGSHVKVTCTNYSTTMSHSCAILASSGRDAFPGSTVPEATRGLAPGRSQTFSFVASRTGRFQIVCIVAGHRDQGMWDWFDVTKSGRASMRGDKPQASTA